jgi:hypothetical protein
MTQTNPRTLAEQAEPVRELIDYARQRDALGKRPASRAQLIGALMILGRDRKSAERAVENARVRVRRAANKAEARLEKLLRNEKLWNWTDPEEAIKEMRCRHFGPFFDRVPLTDIELALVQAGNALWTVAVYPALAQAILSRLGRRQTAEVASPDTH